MGHSAQECVGVNIGPNCKLLVFLCMSPKLGDQKWKKNTPNIKEGIDFMNELLEKQTPLKLETT